MIVVRTSQGPLEKTGEPHMDSEACSTSEVVGRWRSLNVKKRLHVKKLADHSEVWREERNKMSDAVRSCEMKAKSSKKLRKFGGSKLRKQKWISDTCRSWERRVEGVRSHIATDGSREESSGIDAACGWAVVQLGHDKQEDPWYATCGTVLAEEGCCIGPKKEGRWQERETQIGTQVLRPKAVVRNTGVAAQGSCAKHRCCGPRQVCGEELSHVCSQIVLKCLYLARIGRPDILWSVNKLARSITKWTKACDIRLNRLIS